ncbi:unnamed protein product [Moneuplotes crassus]|uniref:Uncharacterized protein n=1 Tax=Euplotes crassus TaxID=5936 RepID=A0AAD1Y2A6_EUPCR|nr:unnamed protein product [Moneuplotes crassus]
MSIPDELSDRSEDIDQELLLNNNVKFKETGDKNLVQGDRSISALRSEEESDMSIPEELSEVDFESHEGPLELYTGPGSLDKSAEEHKSDINKNHLSLLKIGEEEYKAPFHKETTALENIPTSNIDDENFQSNFDEKKDAINHYGENPEEENKHESRLSQDSKGNYSFGITISSKDAKVETKLRKSKSNNQSITFQSFVKPHRMSTYFDEQQEKLSPESKYIKYDKHSMNINLLESSNAESKMTAQSSLSRKREKSRLKSRLKNYSRKIKYRPVAKARAKATKDAIRVKNILSTSNRSSRRINMKQQYENWIKFKSANKSAFFGTSDDCFYENNTKDLQKYSMDNRVNFVQSGDQGMVADFNLQPYLLKTCRNKGKKDPTKPKAFRKLEELTRLSLKASHPPNDYKNSMQYNFLKKVQKNYKKIEKSLNNKKWCSSSLMEMRDLQRSQSKKKMQIRLELCNTKIPQRIKLERKRSLLSRRSQDLASGITRRKILAITEGLSSNGFISYPNFLRVLNDLKLTSFCGNDAAQEILEHYNFSSSQSQDQQELPAEIQEFLKEQQFCKQLWNRMNQFLFNFIDSIILIDVLEIFMTKQEQAAINEFDNYVQGISKTTDISPGDIAENLKRNRDLEVKEIWTTKRIFKYFLKKKPANYHDKGYFGPYAARRMTRIYAEHKKEYSFSPRIIRKKGLDYLQKRHLSLLESGLFEDLNDLLLKELHKVKSIQLEESPEVTGG